MVSRDNSSTSFGAAAGEYEAARPGYPTDAVRWMLGPVASTDGGPRVADVGAGTGKLTRIVAADGGQVFAIDPDPAMLAALADAVPGVPTAVGSAEALPLPDAEFDAVVLGQAWHWVDPVAAAAEIGRVLRPGGVLGLIWNIRDESTPWVARLNSVVSAGRASEMFAAGPPPIPDPFGTVDEHLWHWTRSVTRSQLAALVHSRSYYITADPKQRSTIDSDVAALLDDLKLFGDNTIELPYVTRAYRALRP